MQVRFECGQGRLAGALQGDERVGIAALIVVGLERKSVSFLLLQNVQISSICQLPNRNVVNPLRQNTLAVIASQLEDVEHGSLKHRYQDSEITRLASARRAV